jgi:isoleucyl-tRNA synthetase
MAAFSPLRDNRSFPNLEHEVLDIWKETNAFQRSIDKRKAEGTKAPYIFYDGPPFATGLPHYGHFVASTVKDVVGRYWTMRGYPVERRFGWDTHGLPIEMEVEKTLGLSGPASIRAYGIDQFNEACRSGVLKYTKEWERIIGRLGRWVDFKNDYKTLDLSFMESVWWVFAELWKKGLVYKGFRVMPYSYRLSTPLSNFEANSDYREVDDPALTVKLELVDEPGTFLLIWTTTPWTLPSNVAVAVGTELRYVRAKKLGDDATYIVAEALRETVLGKESTEEGPAFLGNSLVGRHYKPLFDPMNLAGDRGLAAKPFVVVAGHHVKTDQGTGLVHMAPAYGADDFEICQKAGLPLVDTVDEEGNFTALVPEYVGKNIKEADPLIIRALKGRGLILRHDTIRHSYPFCWRSHTPLIYKAMPVWFVKVKAVKDRMVELNQNIHWVPEVIGDKRFGNWLLDAEDWCISRNRFWGTPLPLWQCSNDAEHRECLSSVADLERKSGEKVTDLHPHRINHLSFACAQCDGTMKRIPEVFDCWFESGSMPYAQVHYPFEQKEEFKQRFPAQFIAEGLDQTRLWFYTLLVLSTALFDKEPFENVVVFGLVLAEDGTKMSKSKKNYPDPLHVLEEHGADALRAYLISSPVVRAEPLLFSEQGVRDIVRTVLLPLYHSWSFFVQYANIDGFDPKTDLAKAPPVDERPELDRWVLSKLQSLVASVNVNMEGYYLYKVVPAMIDFVDDLTNWYIRRSRRRFWRNATDAAGHADKLAGYATLYEVLTTFSKVLSPVLPFLTEAIYQNLVVGAGMQLGDENSVHLCDFPTASSAATDVALEREIALVREVVSMGRALRERYKLKTRQPLASVTVVTHDPFERQGLQNHRALIEEELNVKTLIVSEEDDGLCTVTLKPNFKTLGARFGARMKEATAHIGSWSREEFSRLVKGIAIEVLGVPVTLEDVSVTRQPRGDVVIESLGHVTVALNTHIGAELREEGLMREMVSQLQRLRKELKFDVTDRVVISVRTPSSSLTQALKNYESYVADEVLATGFLVEQSSTDMHMADVHSLNVDGEQAWVQITRPKT